MKATEPNWLVSTEIFHSPGSPKLTDALDRADIYYHECAYRPNDFSYEEPSWDKFNDASCTVLYGPIKFVRQMEKHPLTPGSFGFKQSTNQSHYMGALPTELFFNHDAIWLPFGAILEKRQALSQYLGNKFFIRPDSGFKTFTGFDCTIKDLEHELSTLKQTKGARPEDMCVVSSCKEIQAEYRFVIADGKVIAGSQYRWDEVLYVRLDVDPKAEAFAQSVAERTDWRLDDCYVLDVFMTSAGVPKIGEFNSFSSAGLYHCDMDAVVKGVTDIAQNVWLTYV